MLEALYNNHLYPLLTSLELSNDMSQVGKLIPQNIKNKFGDNENDWKLITGKSSLDYFKQLKMLRTCHNAQLYSHDSLHTFSHMYNELKEFKESINEEFYIFIDDEKSDGFWPKCLQMKLFNRPGYNVKYISGAETRLKAHLGGFIQYKKEII